MPDNNLLKEFEQFAAKATIYTIGIILGIAAKLATMNQEKRLTMKDITFQSVIAFASAWVVWWLLKDRVSENILFSVSIVVGRFGDSVLIALGNTILQWLKSESNKKMP